MRGEFVRGDGLVLPNNITTIGGLMILNAAFAAIHAPLAMVLGSGVFTPGMSLADLDEPQTSPGVYQRIALPQTPDKWTAVGPVNGEWAMESVPCVFPAGTYDKSISRVAIIDQANGAVYMIGTPLPAPLLITPATQAPQRTFRYRLYLR